MTASNMHHIKIVHLSLLTGLLLLVGGCKKSSDLAPSVPVDDVIVSPPNPLFRTSVPRSDYDIVVVRPTRNSITLSILSYKTCDAKIEYSVAGRADFKTLSISLTGNNPALAVLDNLLPAQAYDYYYSYKLAGTASYIKSPKYSFTTARDAGQPFVLALTADSHLDMRTDTAVYRKTLDNLFEDKPDFMIELGDTYMNDKYGSDFSMAFYNYLAQRYFFGKVCHSMPLFFVQGNHDGEAGIYNDMTAQSRAVWSNNMRKKYFPMPEPGTYYRGNANKDAYAGYLQNYYAWEWSNALFIVLDPFWYSPVASANDPWARTLGAEQYNWLKETLQNSRATFKFIFLHNLVGGIDIDGKGRGGVEAVPFFEWGGKSISGLNEFAARRPTFEMPIHQLLVKYGVNAVFHGHDHFYGYQQMDGIVYQEIPQPSTITGSNPVQAADYGYRQGTFMGGSGYLRLTIGASSAKVEYVTTDIQVQSRNKSVWHQYILN
jgi:predicted phosphodiesterase